MALKVGDLYVSLTANTQKLQSQLNGAAKKIEAFGRNLKGLGKDASEMSNMVAAAVTAAVAVASSKDAKVKKQVEDLKNASTMLAVEIARLALPVLKQMADFVARIVTLFRSLTPEQRQMVTTFLQVAVAVSAAGMAAMKLEPAFKLVATAIRFVGASLGGLSVGLLPLLAAVASLVVISGLVREAWDSDLGGIQEKAAAVWGWMSENGSKLGETLGKAASWIGKKFQSVFIWIYETYAAMAKKLIEGMSWLGKKIGLDKLVDIDGLAEIGNTVADWVAQLPTDSGLSSLAADTNNALTMIKTGAEKNGRDIKKAIAGIIGDLTGKLPAAAKIAPMADIKVDYGRLRADKMKESFNALSGYGFNLRDAMGIAGAKNIPKELEQFSGVALSSQKGIEDVRDFLKGLGDRAGETEKYLGAWEAWLDEQKKNAAHVDRLRQDRTPQIAAQFLGGGTLGDAARMAGITSGIPPEFESFSGGLLKTASDFEDLRDRLAQVREKNPLIDQFIDAMEAVQEDAAKKAKELEEARKQVVSGFKDQVLGAFGKLGGLVQAATGPLAQALGPLGAVAAVAFDIVSGSAGFQRLVGALDGILQGLSDALGQLLDPVSLVISALRPVVGALGALVGAVLPLLNAVLEPLLPLLVFLGNALQAFAPVVQLIVTVLGAALSPVMWVLGNALKGLAATLQMVAVFVLRLVISLGETWNGIISAVQAVLGFLGNLELFGGKPFAFLSEWAAGLEGAKAATDTYKTQLANVSSVTWDSAMAQATALDTATDAANNFASGLTNAASGFKVDLARFNATNAGGMASPADLQTSGAALSAGGDTYVTIVSNDPEAIWDRLEEVRRRKSFQRGRGPLGGLPAFGG